MGRVHRLVHGFGFFQASRSSLLRKLTVDRKVFVPWGVRVGCCFKLGRFRFF